MNSGGLRCYSVLLWLLLAATVTAEEFAALVVESRPPRCMLSSESLGLSNVERTNENKVWSGLAPGEHRIAFVSKGRRVETVVNLQAGRTLHVEVNFAADEVKVTGEEDGVPAPARKHAADGVTIGVPWLDWLASHQSVEGHWDADGFQERCKALGHAPCAGVAKRSTADPMLTGLALLAMLGSGNSMTEGTAAPVVARAVEYLLSILAPDGRIGEPGGDEMLNQAIGTLALAEAYALSGKPDALLEPVTRALAFLLKSQNPMSGWGYAAGDGDSNMVVTGWGVMALKSTKVSKLDVPRSAFTGALTFLDLMTGERSGQVGYRVLGDADDPGKRISTKSPIAESMTAVGGITRIFLGAPRGDPALEGGIKRLLLRLPRWDAAANSVDFHYWYFGTLFAFQIGAEPWDRWSGALSKALAETVESKGGVAGSWEPIGSWGEDYGRVYTTALASLSLEIFYRHAKIKEDKGK